MKNDRLRMRIAGKVENETDLSVRWKWSGKRNDTLADLTTIVAVGSTTYLVFGRKAFLVGVV